MTRVLIAVDETEESVQAAATAHRLFGDDADYVAVSVADADLDESAVPWWGSAWGTRYPVPYGSMWPLPGLVHPVYPPRSADGVTLTDDAERDAVSTARRAAESSGVATAEPVGEIGDPADAILSAATQHSADVIVLGTHDRSWFERVLGSSVGKDVLEHSELPVLVVP